MRLTYIIGPTPAESYVIDSETGEVVEGVDFVGLGSPEGEHHRLTIELTNFEIAVPAEGSPKPTVQHIQPSKN